MAKNNPPKSTKKQSLFARSRQRQINFLSQSIKMEEGQNPYIVSTAMIALCFVFIMFIGWSAVTEVNEVAHAHGDVVPDGLVQLVQHKDGGYVTEILVEDSQLVEAGDVLLRIDDGGARHDLEERQSIRKTLLIQAEHLRAFIEEREPDFSRIVGENLSDEIATMIREQKSMVTVSEEARAQEVAVIEQQIAQKKNMLDMLTIRHQTLKETVVLNREMLSIKEALYKKGSVSQKDYLEARRDVLRASGEETEIVAEMSAAQKSLAEYEVRKKSLWAQYRKNAFEKLDEIESQIRQNNVVISKLEERVDRLDLKSPVHGIVKGLTLNTVGGVVEPGKTLMEIVPIDKNLIVEARISTSDIGHISVGQPVIVKVLSYDFSRYGAVDGELASISATTFLDRENNPYYRALIHLKQDFVGTRDRALKIMPGMTIEADILTGRKTILGYLLKPLRNAMSQALTER